MLNLYVWQNEGECIAVNRSTMRQEQSANEDDSQIEPTVVATSEGGICPSCGAKEVVHEGGCLTCKQCGWSKCS